MKKYFSLLFFSSVVGTKFYKHVKFISLTRTLVDGLIKVVPFFLFHFHFFRMKLSCLCMTTNADPTEVIMLVAITYG
uniref:Uncharacterized protein n=1 Tax=Arundo donax TaxID=35708 RepID=A0A0A9FHX2_ARUDO